MGPISTASRAIEIAVQFLYCNAKEKGIWFLPKKGMGPMESKGRAILKEIVEGR